MRPGVVLQHEPSGPPARLAEWLEGRSIAYETRRVWEQGVLTDPSALAWICSLGSDQTPGRPGAPAWVEEEVGFLRRAVAEGVPVLGLCFGAQALAAAAGARIGAADPPEVGWFEIDSSDEERIPRGPWLHFHYDQLMLPAGASELARSGAGTAAFRLGPHLGLQFHPEATPEIADGWAEAEHGTLARLGIDRGGLARAGERCGEPAAAAARRLFDAWWSEVPSGR